MEALRTAQPVFSPRPAQERAARQRQALLQLTRPGTTRSGDLRATLRELTRRCAEALEIERSSVWLFDTNGATLQLSVLYERTRGRHTSGAELRVADFPAYFEAIARSEVVAAVDAQADPRTRELGGHLAPPGIRALLTAPVFAEGVLRGVVRFEHAGGARPWTDDEETFAVAVASLVALALGQEERRESEEALRFQKCLLEAQSEASQDGILVVSREGRIISHNRRLLELWEVPEEVMAAGSERALLLFTLGKMVHPKEFLARIRHLQANPDLVASEELALGDGRVFEHYSAPVRAPGRAFYGRVWFFRDVTARKRLEAQLRQGQKMEAIGRLAGGVAHDFNNLLTAILGYSDVLASKLAGQDPLLADLAEIKQSGERAAGLTSQLLAFSRKQNVQPRVLDLNQVVARIEKMLRRLIGEDVELAADLASDLGRVRADAGQLEQVLMNLAVNARDAMPRGGRLTIQTRDVELDAEFVRHHPGSRAGSHVLLRVSDTGMGMAKEVLAHLFEPFFTTKEMGKGTGLGLATVYGIVKQNGGYVGVRSEPGRGTSFDIYLPRVEEEASRGADTSVHMDCVPGRGRVLLAEDEVVVRRLVREMLRISGYSVVEAENGEEALRIARSDPRPFDLLMTDVVMPRLGGHELARQLRLRRPDLPVLYMTGYTDDAAFRQSGLEPGSILLPKPFSPNEMLAKVRKTLQLGERLRRAQNEALNETET